MVSVASCPSEAHRQTTWTVLRAVTEFGSAQRALLILLIIADVLVIASHVGVHLARDTGWVTDTGLLDALSVNADGQFPESYGYAKLALIVGILVIAAIRLASPLLWLAAAANSYAWADDALTLHERFAVAVAGGRVALSPIGVHWYDIAEFAALAVPGLFFLGFFAWFAVRTGGATQAFAVLFGVLFLALGFFAAGLDLLHELIGHAGLRVSQILNLMEDGGELMVLTPTVGAALIAYNFAQRAGAGSDA